MKKLILLASIIIVCSQVANAQQPASKSQQAQRGFATQEEWIENKVDRMDDALNLSDAQEKKIEKIFKKNVTAKSQITPEQAKVINTEIRKVLNPEQIKKYEEMGKNRPCARKAAGNCPHQHGTQHGECSHQNQGHQHGNCPHGK